MKDIKIDGLTAEHAAMLAVMWTIDTTEDFDEWVQTLSKEEVKMALTLKELLIAHVLDDVSDHNLAKAYLRKFRITQ